MLNRFFDNDTSRTLANRLHFRAFSVGFGDEHHLRKQKYQWNDCPVPQDLSRLCTTPFSHSDFTELPYWTQDFWWK